VFHPNDEAGLVNFKEGVYLIKEPTDLFALSARCTHLGCTLTHDAVSERFVCPCHGSVFSRSGQRLAGPAVKDLERIPLTMKDGGDIEAVVTTG